VVAAAFLATFAFFTLGAAFLVAGASFFLAGRPLLSSLAAFLMRFLNFFSPN